MYDGRWTSITRAQQRQRKPTWRRCASGATCRRTRQPSAPGRQSTCRARNKARPFPTAVLVAWPRCRDLELFYFQLTIETKETNPPAGSPNSALGKKIQGMVAANPLARQSANRHGQRRVPTPPQTQVIHIHCDPVGPPPPTRLIQLFVCFAGRSFSQCLLICIRTSREVSFPGNWHAIALDPRFVDAREWTVPARRCLLARCMAELFNGHHRPIRLIGNQAIGSDRNSSWPQRNVCPPP